MEFFSILHNEKKTMSDRDSKPRNQEQPRSKASGFTSPGVISSLHVKKKRNTYSVFITQSKNRENQIRARISLGIVLPKKNDAP